MSHERRPAFTRRRLLQATGAASAVGLAGCSGEQTAGETDGQSSDGETNDGDGNASDDEADEKADDDSPPSYENELEVLHGWVGGDGGDAMSALTAGFESAHPDVETYFRPIGGGGATNLNTVVSNRLSQHEPPSSFAGWPGRNLERYDGLLGDVEADVWDEAGLEDANVPEVGALCRHDGEYVAASIGSHRVNCLFYNVRVVEDAGVDPGSMSSLSDLFRAMDRIAANTDAVPMAHAMIGPWTTLQLFATILLGQEGYDPYMTFVEGKGGESAVRNALETTRIVLSNYITDDAASISFTESNARVVNGEAAFIHQGNWAAGAYRDDGLTYGKDWGHVAFPGTGGMYLLHLDSFVYPVDDDGENPSPEATEAWLRYVGGREGQRAFNAPKGSIPTRTDVSTDDFGPYRTETIDDFRTADRRPPSITHGLAVAPAVLSKMKGVITENFTGPFDVEATAQGLLDAVAK